jgi:competence protein ComEA
MRSRSLAAQHDAAVARRLELLTTELAAVGERGTAPETRVDARPSSSPHDPLRIRAVPELADDDGDDPGAHDTTGVGPPPTTVRMPGRHASRRTPRESTAGAPSTVWGRVSLGPGQVAVVAVLSVVGLALTCWWLVRGAGHEVMAPTSLATPQKALPTPDGGGITGGGPALMGVPASTSDAKARVVVDVAGKVRHPGLAVLRPGARVIDALRAAGDARPGVDLGGLNLARVLTDGEQVVVGQPAPTGSLPSSSSSEAPGTGLVDLNTADETTLESLPEVGPVTAQAIITWRTQNGGFASVDQLLDVDGIGDATLAKLMPYVTI